MENKYEYNDRLFNSGFLRRFYHYSRYKCCHKFLKKNSYSSVLELGCFDAKLAILSKKYISSYTGIDAN